MCGLGWNEKPRRPFTRQLLVWRSRFEAMWGELPKLTILVAAPGWGKTTWMEQAVAHVGDFAAPVWIHEHGISQTDEVVQT